MLLELIIAYLVLALGISEPSQLDVMLLGPTAQGENSHALDPGEGGETETGEGLAG